jgi:hypothetical protein
MECINDWKDATRTLARIHFVSIRTTSSTLEHFKKRGGR